MKRKTRKTSSAQASETPITPRSWALITTPRTLSTLSGNGLSKNFCCGDQIQPAAPFKITSRAIVTITTISSDRCAKGRMIAQVHEHPADEREPSVSVNESQ